MAKELQGIQSPHVFREISQEQRILMNDKLYDKIKSIPVTDKGIILP